MEFFQKLSQIIAVSRSHQIARRYLVVNGFDGALTTLGLLIGFTINEVSDLKICITACVGAAIALGVSGFSSAYVSESAERKQEFDSLQDAMITDLSGSTHETASRWIPIIIGAINGLSPLLISLAIITPLWLANAGIPLPLEPKLFSIGCAFTVIFLLGVFLSRVSGQFWLASGLQTLAIAFFTSVIIFLVA